MKSLKLNQIEKNVLSTNEMNQVTGGARACTCGCLYENRGGSSFTNNGNANYGLGSNGGYTIDSSGSYKFVYDLLHSGGSYISY